jgi:hypothetical protein
MICAAANAAAAATAHTVRYGSAIEESPAFTIDTVTAMPTPSPSWKIVVRAAPAIE